MANILDKIKKIYAGVAASDEVKNYTQRLSALGDSIRSGLSEIAANKPRNNDYDAQFTPEYFDSNPEKYGRLVELDYKTASMEDLISSADTLWKIQAGENYRSGQNSLREDIISKVNPQAKDQDYGKLTRARESDAYARNSAYNRNSSDDAESILREFKNRATEEEFRSGVDVLKANYEAAGDGDYKDRLGRAIEDLEEYGRNNYSGFMQDAQDKLKYDTYIAQQVIDRIKNNPKSYVEQDFQSFMDPGVQDRIAFLNGGSYYFSSLTPEAKEVYDKYAQDFNAQRSYTSKAEQQISSLEARIADLNNEYAAGQEKLEEQKKWEGYAQQTGAYDNAVYDYNIASVPQFVGYEEVRVENENGLGNIEARANQATLDQIVAHPEQVMAEVKKIGAIIPGADEDGAVLAQFAANMHDDEKRKYFEIRHTQGEEAAAEYFDLLMEKELYARDQERVAREAAEYAEAYPIQANIASVAAAPFSAIAGATAFLTGEDNPNAPTRQMSIYKNQIRETTGQNIAEAVPMESISNKLGFNPLQVAYSGIMEGIDSITSFILTGGNPAAAAGFQAADVSGESYFGALDRGLDTNIARISTIGSVAIEYLTEKLPLDKLMKTKPADTVGRFIANIIKQGATEAGEEATSEFANKAWSWLVERGDDELTQRYKDLTQNGYSHENALWLMAGEVLRDVGASAFGGFVAGGAMGTGATAIETAQQSAIDKQTGQQILEQGNAEAIIRAAEEYDGKSRSIRALGKRLRAKMQASADGTLPDDAETRAETQVLQEEMAAEGVQPDTTEAAQPETNPETTEETKANNEAISQYTGSPKKLGKLYRQLVTALEVDTKKATKAEMRDAIRTRLEQLGERPSEAVVEAVAATVEGDELSQHQVDILEAAAYAKPVLNELLGSLARNSTDWTSRITSEATAKKIDTMNSLRRATREKISLDETDAEEPEIKVSDSGTATVTDAGGAQSEAEVVGIADAVDGVLQAVVKVDGKEQTVPITQVQAASEDQATLIARASELGDTNAANEMIRMFRGGDATAFAEAFTSAYEYGTTGGSYTLEQAQVSARTTGLSREQIKTAYDLGKAREAAEAAKSVPFRSSTKGRLTLTGRAANRAAVLDANQKSAIHALRRIAEVTGVNIEIFESAANEKGEYASENGSFDRSTNTMRIDINAGRNSKASTASYALLRVAGHELTHYIRANNRAGYQKLQDFATQILTEKDGRNFDELVAAKQDAYERQFKKDLSYDDAVEEVVADASEMMLKDSAAIQQLAQKDKSLFKRIRSWITNFVNSVKRAFQSVNAQSEETKAMLSRMDELQKLWDDALVQAVENTKTVETKANVQLENVKYSTRDGIEFAGDKYYSRLIDQIEDAKDGSYIRVGGVQNGSVLNQVGLPSASLYFDVSKIKKQLEKHEDHLDKNVLKQIPDILRNPVVVAEANVDNTVNVFGDLTVGESPVMVAIMVARDRSGRNIINKVRTIHARRDYMSKITDENVLYLDANKKRTRNWFQARGNVVPLGGTRLGLIRSIASSEPGVKEKFSLRNMQDEDSDKLYRMYDELRSVQNELREVEQMERDAQNNPELLDAMTALIEYNGSRFSPEGKARLRELKQAYINIAEKLGINGLGDRKSNLESRIRDVRRDIDAFEKELGQHREQQAIEKSGLSKTEYFRKQAIKEFGYTSMFVDAGYMLPDGKMLNFSGEKGKHFGTRGQDHRAIGVIYETTTGTKALTRFMNDGNIRVIAESPGIDITSLIEPTPQQYGKIKTMIREYADRNFFSVDISNENGKVVGNYMYEGKINADRVVNDIKYYFETGELREQSHLGEFLSYQLRDPYNLTDREMLVGALETAATSDAERNALGRYRGKIAELYELEEQLAPKKEEISAIYRSRGKRDMAHLNRLKAEAADLEDKISKIDKQILNLESTASLKSLLEREKAKLNRKASADRKAALGRVRERREATELRHKIRTVLDDFNRRLKNPSEKKYIPANFVNAVIAAGELINTDSGRGGEKAAAKIAQIRGLYEQYKSDPMFNYAYDEVVAGMLDNLQQIAGNKSIYQLGRDELQAVYDVVKALKKQVTEAIQLKSGEYGRNIVEVGREMALDTIAAEPLFKNEKISDLLNWHLSPNRFFARLGGYKKGSAWTSVVADSFNRGTETMYEIQRDFYNHFREYSESKLFDTLTSRKKLVDIGLKDKQGKKIEVTRGMMLSIYMHLLNEDNRRGIMYGGLTIPDLSKYYNGKMGDAYGRGSTMTIGTASELYSIAKRLREDNLSDAQREALEAEFDAAIASGEARLDRMMSAIEKQLTGFEKNLIKAAQAWNDGKSQQYINDVTMDLYGIKKANVKNYWRIHRDTSFIQTDFDSISKNVNLENWGSLKARVPSQAPVLLTDFAFEMDSNMQQMSRYVGFARAQRDFKKLYNVRLPGMDGSVKKAVASKFGTGKKAMGVTGEQYIENFIGDITGSRSGETAFWGAVRRNIPRASLSLNLRVAASQLSAIPTAAAEVGWGSMAKGAALGLKNLGRKRLEQISQENVWFWQRYRGDGGMREFADMKGGGNFIDKGYNWIADTKIGGWLLNWCQKTDVASTAMMYAMAEDWVKKHTSHATGTVAFKEAVNEKFSLILRNTQPNYTATEAADVLRDKREAVKMFTMFKTQNYQNFNMLYDAMANLRKTARDFKNKANGVTKADLTYARQRAAAATTSVIVGANVAFSLLRLLVNAIMQDMNSYRDDDDELTAKSVIGTMLTEMGSSIVGMTFAGEELYEAILAAFTDKYYYGLNDSAIGEISDLVTTAVNGDWSKADTYKKMGFGVARIVGIPAQNVTKYYTAVSAWTKDFKNDEVGKFEGSVSRSNSTNYNRMLEASIAGDEAKWNAVKAELLEDPDLDNDEILSGYRGKIGEAYKDGELTYEQATDLLIKYGEKSEGDAYWQLDKWGYSKETGSSEDYEKYRELDAALVSGNAANIREEIKIVDANNDTKSTIQSIVKSQIRTLYLDGDINATQVKTLLQNYCSTENTDYSDVNVVYWQMKDWDYAKANGGSSDGYSKYGTFFASVEKGGSSLQKAAQELLTHGTKKSNIASAIAGQYKEQYVTLYRTNPTKAAQLLEKILDAYVAIGYDRNYERNYIAKNWFKEDDE